MATGYPRSTSTQITEVLETKNKDANCQNLPDFPEEISSATGSTIQGQPLVCGGSDDNDVREDCWTLEKSKSSWRRLNGMKSKRRRACSVPVNDSHLWVFGGSDGDRRLQSTEFVDLEGNSKAGPEMPEPISSHAIVALKDATYLLIGGTTDNKTYYFSEKTQNWTPGPSLKIRRHAHTAGIIIDDVTAAKYIVVAGGWDLRLERSPSRLDSTEILKYPGSTEWQHGKHSNNLIFDI